MSEEAAAPPPDAVRVRAEKMAAEATGAGGVAIDPTVFITIILAILKAMGVCGLSATDALARLRSPGVLVNMLVHRTCAKHARKGTEKFDVLVSTVFDQAPRLTVEEVKAMCAVAGVAPKE